MSTYESALGERKVAAKEAELRVIAADALRSFLEDDTQSAGREMVDRAAEELLRTLATITPPDLGTTHQSDYLSIGKYGKGGGMSIKPGNVRLNLRSLIKAVAGGTLTIVGAVSVPWTLPLAALMVWNELRDASTVQIDEEAASVLWTMWLYADANYTIAGEGLLELVNGERKKAKDNDRKFLPLDARELETALVTLKKINLIEPSVSDASRWWLREFVNAPYV